LLGPGDLLSKFGRELPVDGRGVDTDLLEDTTLHHGHAPAASGTTGMVRALPRREREPSCRLVSELASRWKVVLERLERRADDLVPKLLEPGPSLGLARFEQIVVHGGPLDFPPV